ncbi:leucine-rich repeat domain-containing protein [Phormidium sp. LEGE 05292]|uniref:leucine-rich repeat domain-containing protein n=1 Tax=[Phormidium] sp. LEGE 05292 TaxID=767427 RepID=UPI00188043F7|nr:leucine-rich repeat domain-containing protein [Phormidium sp. LEGE 05292]MBE9226377.1 leucine-rich repeat domain-containing protein [Phormidium sp. LEGE 05292]
MNDELDCSMFTRFTDWCRAKDSLPPEAKRTVEALKETIELGYLLNWTPGEVETEEQRVVTESIFLACTELGLRDYYDEFPLAEVWSLIPDEVRTELEIEITESILLASTKLDLSDICGYSFQLTDLRPLASFTHLTSLDLRGAFKDQDRSKLSDISILSTFTNLTELNLSSNSITDLSPLSTLTELRELNLSRNFITDLTPLKALKNLTVLSLSGDFGDRAYRLTESIDLSPLLALTQLKDLDLSSNEISDRSLETIAQLTTLERLWISYNRITDISPLATLQNLKYLSIHDNDITDLSTLERLPCLDKQQYKPEPQLTIRQPADLERLATLTNLNSLKLAIDYSVKNEPWLDLTPLSRLTRLTRLDLRGYEIGDLSPLQTLTRLTRLELDGCGINDLTPLQTLTELTYLQIGSKCLADLSPLKFLINLTELQIWGRETSITDLSPLASLTKLTKLYLSSGLISDLSPLQRLTELTYIDCRSAKITDVSPLASLTKLEHLNLVGNQITDISPLRSLVNLRDLYINNNPIEDTSPLLFLPKLEYCSVRIQRLTVFAPTHDPANPLTPLPILQQQYRELLTQPIDRSQATAAVTSMYAAMGLPSPEIYFFESPLAGVERYDREQKTQIPQDALGDAIVAQLVQSAMPVGSAAWKAGWQMMQFQPGEAIRASLGSQIWQDAAQTYLWLYVHESKQMVACGSDFDAIKGRAYLTPEDLVELISVSQMYVEQEASHYAAQEAMQQLLATCGWIIPYEKVCIVCDRPRHVRLDEENQLHGINEPAIEFADGWHSGYYQHGQQLPPEAIAIIKGWRLLEEHNYSTALSHCQDCIAKFSKQSGFFTIRGVALMKLGSLESAMAAFDEAIQLERNDANAWYNRACLRVDLADSLLSDTDTSGKISTEELLRLIQES